MSVMSAGAARGKVLLCPPSVVNSAMLRTLGRTRTAILTGWAVDPNCRYRYRCDAAFPLSDHADFPDLLEFARRVNPKRVFTLHGFAADFAQTLRDEGYAAQALSEEEQFSLNLGFSTRAPVPGGRGDEADKPGLAESGVASLAEEDQPSFRQFAECCEAISHTAGKLEKIRLLSVL